MRGKTLTKYITEQMKNPAFKKAWDDLDTEFELIESMIKARKKRRISQSELAEKIGLKQSAIARLESGGYDNATIKTLSKIANALNTRLVIKLQPKKSA